MNRAKWKDTAWEADGETINIEETQFLREESDGERLPDNAPSEKKWKAAKALYRLKLSGTEHQVLGCLIDLANSKTGLCYPSEEYISGWIDRPLRSVQRAISSLRRKKLIEVVWRSQTSNRYFINWQRLFSAFRKIEAFVLGQSASRRQDPSKAADQDVKSGGSHPSKAAAEPSESNLLSMNLRHEMVPQPSAERTLDAFLKEVEVIQGERVETPEPITNSEARRKVLSELGPFEKQWLTKKGLDAAAEEEMKEPGSGFAVARGLATLSWQQSRQKEAS